MGLAIIVAGGTGSRMQANMPKQFIEIHGKPILIWTMERFRKYDPEIRLVLVMNIAWMKYWEELADAFPAYADVVVESGGETRYDSVKRGLAHAGEAEFIAIHDAVRPLVSTDTIQRCFDAASVNGSAIPVIEPGDSIRMTDGSSSNMVDRSLVRIVQTPQVFRTDRLLKAYQGPHEAHYTDDASVYEACFGNVHLVPGNRENIKITFPSDLLIAEAFLGKEG